MYRLEYIAVVVIHMMFLLYWQEFVAAAFHSKDAANFLVGQNITWKIFRGHYKSCMVLSTFPICVTAVYAKDQDHAGKMEIIAIVPFSADKKTTHLTQL